MLSSAENLHNQKEITNSSPAHDFLTQVAQELDALEKQPIQGWDIVYVNLYKMLDGIIEDICTKMQCSKPGLVLNFSGVQKHQAAAYIMTNSTTQLHVGAALIRKYLLQTSPESAKFMKHSFKWIIAHEIGHLCDPSFKTYAKTYQLRTILDRIGFFWIGIGIGNLIMPGSISFINNPTFLVSGIIFVLLKKLGLVLLHHKFEYTADALSFSASREYSVEEAAFAIHTMTHDIAQFIEQQTTPSSVDENSTSITTLQLLQKAYVTFCQKLLIFKYFHLHPAIDKRIKRIKSLLHSS